jgi:hypothetical protein
LNLKPGRYRLTTTIKNPARDRRRTTDWRVCKDEIKEGTEFNIWPHTLDWDITCKETGKVLRPAGETVGYKLAPRSNMYRLSQYLLVKLDGSPWHRDHKDKVDALAQALLVNFEYVDDEVEPETREQRIERERDELRAALVELHTLVGNVLTDNQLDFKIGDRPTIRQRYEPITKLLERIHP